MNLLEKKLELAANIAIIVVAVALLGVIAQRFFVTPENPSIKELKVGDTFDLPEVNWAENKKTLVLVLQENCRFCQESMPFYKKLVEKTQTKVVAVFPSSVEKTKVYLKEQGVEITEVRQATSGKIGVSGTPTLVLVDAQGKVIDSWMGKLPAEDEEKVLQKIECKEGANCN